MVKLKDLILLAACAGAAVILLPAVHAAYLESGTEELRAVEPLPRIIPPIPEPRPANAITRLIQRVKIGRPYSYCGLTIYPLVLRSSQWNSGIRTLDEALRHGWIIIHEKDNDNNKHQ